MNTASPGSHLASKPGGWTELALTLPVFLVYQLGVVFLNVRNATDLVTGQILALAHGDRLTYLELTSGVGLALMFVFALVGRGQAFRPSKVAQIALEGAAYAIAMGTATSWIVGKMFAGPAPAQIGGPLSGIVMALGAGRSLPSRCRSSSSTSSAWSSSTSGTPRTSSPARFWRSPTETG